MDDEAKLNKNKLPTIDVAMLGARMHYAVPRLLDESGILGRFYTDIYMGNKPRFKYLLGKIPINNKYMEKLSARKDDIISPEKVVSFDLMGLKYWWLQNSSKCISDLSKVFTDGGKSFCRNIIKYGLDRPDIIFGFNSASLELFEHAREKGIKCILEQTIAPRRVQRELLLQEVNRWPGWQPELELSDEYDPLQEREEMEWDLADCILGGSDFVTRNIIDLGVSEDKCRVVPYGVSLEKFKPAKKRRLYKRSLHILFVGEIGLRKGVPYILEALKLLNTKSVEAWFAGRISVSPDIIQKYERYSVFLRSVPRNRIFELYEWADVLVLPSICEGSATVTYEALASGVPVIATPNTGTIVEDGVDGHIVPIRDSEAVARSLEGYINDPELLHQEQLAAVSGCDKAGMDAYKERLLGVLNSS